MKKSYLIIPIVFLMCIPSLFAEELKGCTMDLPMCPDGSMSKGRDPNKNCEPICGKNKTEVLVSGEKVLPNGASIAAGPYTLNPVPVPKVPGPSTSSG